MVMLAPLSLPVTTGVELATRMRYALPAAVPLGMVAAMVPAAVAVNVPMLVGLAKEPVELESWAVNTLPAVKVPTQV